VLPLGEFVPEKGIRGVGLKDVLFLVTLVKVVGQLISVIYGDPVAGFTAVLPPDHVILTGKLAPGAIVFEVTVAVILTCVGGYAWQPTASH
jgi:hypothetical protein